MALVHADRCQDTTTTTGTGTVTLSGSAPTGYQTFTAGVGDGNTCWYCIELDGEWETGLGTYASAGPTLARTTVFESTNADSAVNFGAGTKNVFTCLPKDVIWAGRQTWFVHCSAATPTVSNGAAYVSSAETTALRPDIRSIAFDATADEHVQFQVAFPDSWDKGTITYDYKWHGAAVTTGVAFALMGVATSDNESLDTAFGTAVVVTDDAQGAVEEINQSAESAAVTIAGTPANGDLVTFDLYRDVSDGNDDMNSDAGWVSLNIYYNTISGNDT